MADLRPEVLKEIEAGPLPRNKDDAIFYGIETPQAFARRIAALQQELEREECAKVAEGGSFLHEDAPAARFGKECAAAIRRRWEP